MAQFRATIKGQRGEASRLGNKRTGLVANVNGWQDGIRVEVIHENGQDVFRVYLTNGSDAHQFEAFIGTLCAGKWEAAE